MVLLALAAPIAVRLIPTTSDTARRATVGIVDGTSDGLGKTIVAIGETAGFDLMVVDLDATDQPEVDDLLRSGRVDVVVEPPSRLVWDDSRDSTLETVVTAAIGQVAAVERAEELGIDLGDLGDVFAPVDVSTRFVDGSEDTEDVRRGAGLFGLLLAFLLPQIFGQLTLLSIVEEKSTRVVEILLSHIRPATLLVGKVLGLCSLAAVQLVLLVLGMVGSLLASDVVDIPSSVWQFVPLFTVSIIGGLLIYNTLFALLGSLISRQEDGAEVLLPLFVPLMLGYFVGQSAVLGDAESVWAKVLTWFPLTMPMLLPVRVARDAIGPVEIVVSIALLVATVWLLIRLASRVYEYTLLRTGARVGWGEFLRMVRGSAG